MQLMGTVTVQCMEDSGLRYRDWVEHTDPDMLFSKSQPGPGVFSAP